MRMGTKELRYRLRTYHEKWLSVSDGRLIQAQALSEHDVFIRSSNDGFQCETEGLSVADNNDGSVSLFGVLGWISARKDGRVTAVDNNRAWEHFIPIPDRGSYKDLFAAGKAVSREEYERYSAELFADAEQFIRSKKTIKVGFVLYDASMWCGDELYRLFEQNERYQPTVFLCKRKGDTYRKDFETGLEQFRERGLRVIGVCNSKMPVPYQDLLLLLTPYFKPLPEQFKDFSIAATQLLVNIPYSLGAGKFGESHKSETEKLWWKTFAATNFQAQIYSNKLIPRERIAFSGAPKMDALLSRHSLAYHWKQAQPDSIKIIWAPHWSVQDTDGSSTFRWNHQFFFEYAKAHPKTSWIVKPHPNLPASAIKEKVFENAEAFEEYLKRWDSLPNAKVVTGGYYQSIFATSDGLINDSVSFIIEYQYTLKPMLMLTRNTTLLNDFGKQIVDVNYQADGTDFNAIENFINNVLHDHNDSKADARAKFFNSELNYQAINGMSASNMIFHTINNALGRNTYESHSLDDE